MSPRNPDAEPLDGRAAYEWRMPAHRFAPLIDGEAYFAAVRSSMLSARRQILIVGWELHSEVALLRGDRADEAHHHDGYPVTLADLLLRLVEERAELSVHLLIWKGAALFALEREHLPRMKRPWDQHPRIRLAWAEDTPKLGSHHQKFVVIDDRMVFAGGMDLTKSRWDTHAHRIDEPLRKKPGLISSYSNPYHDAMAAFEGKIAETLGDYARERWEQATSQPLDRPDRESDADSRSPWPDAVQAILTDHDVHIALTEPDYRGRRERRQVEASFVRQIRAAKRLIYIETQYLTASRIVDELADRLREPGGPEIVIILPYGCPGVLQSMALDHERDRLIAVLRDADPGDRLGIYWPTLAGGDEERPFETSVYVHAKVLVIDDRILRIGSANLNNRSMGLDTELDTWVETDADDPKTRDAIASFRQRSLSYLLGCNEQVLRRSEQEHGLCVAAIDSVRGGERTLHPFEHRAPEYSRAGLLDMRLADPGRPLDDVDAKAVLRAMADQAGVMDQIRKVRSAVIGVVRHHKGWSLSALVLVVLGLLTLVAALGNLGDSFDVEATLHAVRSSRIGGVGVLVALVVLGSVGFPITALVVGVGVVIGSWWAPPLAMLGVLVASTPGFAFGRFAPKSATRALAAGTRGKVARVLKPNAVLSVAALRNRPIAPFAVVNAALGLTELTWTAYLVGTVIGMLPGVVLLSLFGRVAADLLAHPTPAGAALLGGLVLGMVVVSITFQRLPKRFAPTQRGNTDS